MNSNYTEILQVTNRLLRNISHNIKEITILSYLYTYAVDNKLITLYSNEIYEYANNQLIGLTQDDKEILEETYSKISFSDLLMIAEFLINSSDIRVINSTKNMSELAVKLLELKENDSIIDLGSGKGTFLNAVLKNYDEKKKEFTTVKGIELDLGQLMISKMALDIISNKNFEKISIDNADILMTNIDGGFNKGYAFPPFGMTTRLDNYSISSCVINDYSFNVRVSMEALFIDRLLGSLTGENKRGVVVVPGRMLFGISQKKYLSKLIETEMLEGIIQLPERILPYTSIGVFLLVFSQNNKRIKLIDASGISIEKPHYNSEAIFEVQDVLDKYYDSSAPSKTRQELTEIENWIPSIALLETYKINNGTKLKEVAKISYGSQYTISKFKKSANNVDTKYKIITSSDIQDGLIHWDNLAGIDNDDTKLDKYVVQVNDLIMTSKSSITKMAVVDIKPNENCIVTGGMIIVRPDTSKLNPTFLKIFLESKYGDVIMRKIQKGTVIVSMNVEDLGNLEIPLPDIKLQNKLASKYNNKLSSLLSLKNQVSKIEKELKYFYNEENLEGND